MGKIKVNEIEKHDATEVTVNSDVVMAAGTSVSSPSISTDTISEKTSAAGVTIDGVLIKDGQVDGVDVSTLSVDTNNLVKLASATASNDAAIIFDNFVDQSIYSHYIIKTLKIVPATNAAYLRMTFRQGGASGSDITGNYYGMQWASFGNAAISGFDSNFSQSGAGDVTNSLPNSASGGTHGSIIDFYPCDGTHGGSSYWAQIIGKDNNNNIQARVRARHIDSQTACTGARFFMSSGNITSGEIIVYGVKK